METNIDKSVIRLTGFFDTCPIYWQNFIDRNFERGKLASDKNKDTRTKKIIKLLDEKYNASYNPGTLDEKGLVIFDTEEDFIYFKLKYS